MILLPALAAIGASCGWATGIVLAQAPASAIGAFEFTRIQLISCGVILGLICAGLGYWPTVDWGYWPAYAASIVIGIVLGNLAMIECLRRGGPRRTELLLSLKAPLVGVMAFLWLDEVPTGVDLFGACVALAGVCLAIGIGGGKTKSDRMTGSMLSVVLLGVGATACQGFGFLVMKPAMLAGVEPIAASALRLLGAALLISTVALWPSPVFRHAGGMTPALLFRTVLPGFIGYCVSSSLLLYAFANFDAGIAAVLGSLSPVLVLPLLWIKDRRPPRPAAIAGAGMAVLGTGIIVLG